MRVKKVFLAASVFTLLTASAAFGGTWKNGKGNWQYDNGEGTEAW